MTDANSHGGLVGFPSIQAPILNSYWDQQSSGQPGSPGGGTGLTTAQLQASLPSGFSSNIWATTSGNYPNLQWETAGAIPTIQPEGALPSFFDPLAWTFDPGTGRPELAWEGTDLSLLPPSYAHPPSPLSEAQLPASETTTFTPPFGGSPPPDPDPVTPTYTASGSGAVLQLADIAGNSFPFGTFFIESGTGTQFTPEQLGGTTLPAPNPDPDPIPPIPPSDVWTERFRPQPTDVSTSFLANEVDSISTSVAVTTVPYVASNGAGLKVNFSKVTVFASSLINVLWEFFTGKIKGNIANVIITAALEAIPGVLPEQLPAEYVEYRIAATWIPFFDWVFRPIREGQDASIHLELTSN